jgi:hypothetical protein
MQMWAAWLFCIATSAVSARLLIDQVSQVGDVNREIPCPDIFTFAPEYRNRRAWKNRHVSSQSLLKAMALQRVFRDGTDALTGRCIYG